MELVSKEEKPEAETRFVVVPLVFFLLFFFWGGYGFERKPQGKPTHLFLFFCGEGDPLKNETPKLQLGRAGKQT